MIFIPALLALLVLTYLLILQRLLYGLNKIGRYKKNREKNSVSIIVAAKNEEQTIKNCVESLLAQDYPKSILEIVIIDDHSTDKTYEILKSCEGQYPELKIISLKNQNTSTNIINSQLNKKPHQSSKKSALEFGIKKAAGKLLLFTDADCEPPNTWVKEMAACFDNDVGVVAGFSPLIDKTNSLPGKLFELDSLVAATTAAAGLSLNKPITCTGRNFAYRKKVFMQVNGFTDILQSVSGDDDLFLHLVKQKTNWKIKYNTSGRSIVPSYQTKTLNQFFLQKRRHISAAKYYPTGLKIIYSLMHLTNFSIYFFLITAIFSNKFLLTAIALFLIKVIIDYFFVSHGATTFNKKNLIKYFPLWELFHFGYNLVIGPWAMVGKIKWK